MPLSCPACRLLLAGPVIFLAVSLAQPQREPVNAQPASPVNLERQATPVPPEKNSITSHEITLGGKPLRYVATAGNLLIKGDDNQPNAVFSMSPIVVRQKCIWS